MVASATATVSIRAGDRKPGAGSVQEDRSNTAGDRRHLPAPFDGGRRVATIRERVFKGAVASSDLEDGGALRNVAGIG